MKRYDLSPVRDRVVAGEKQRFCKRHQGWWPLEKFVKAKNGRAGYLGFCRACRNDQRRVAWEKRKPMSPRKARPRAKPLRIGSFKCLGDCGLVKSLEDFPINRGISRGHGSYCRDCDNAARRRRAAA